MKPQGQQHPGVAARAVRALRGLRHLRGWASLANRLAGRAGAFRVANDGVWIEGELNSFVERQAYLFGGYERDEIAAFLSRIPANRRRTILDIGANVGTHTLQFSRAFDAVHSFEPNPLVFGRLQRNLSLNAATNVVPHHLGLGTEPGSFQLYSPAGGNGGLGTLVTTDQYDAPLEAVATVQVEQGDALLARLNVGPVDAIKCDVQGFEISVLEGLQETIRRDRPVLWIELGSGVQIAADEAQRIVALVPERSRFYRITGVRHGATHRLALHEATPDALMGGDYLIVPEPA
ncbi:FkbM family methyltransferase [Sphingomonas sp.]|uniref:FkbM family methyltransferase n=1 Tax=Sphingomonas sp. TaxID=28214 RepID=UPI0025E6FB88|nr:FkbM family methyltransferase [Sphingomonas sp.]